MNYLYCENIERKDSMNIRMKPYHVARECYITAKVWLFVFGNLC